ncbi:MAG TPA: phenylacetate-CoA oxygenase/reductase subunit PaaK [Chitinophagaceae bacterium]|nr:phenylacetate-CoA oxygenase/reductase subunit PaaK [Chitinophagaceae bacterium]
MSAHFHAIRIHSVKKETDQCIAVSLDIPEGLRELFQYTQGQNLTFRTYINKEEVRRTYSLCSSPLDREWKVAIKKVEGGLFSSFANEQLRAGDMIEVMPPSGRFYTPLHPEQQKHYVAIAAGSGITPVLSLVKTTLTTEPKSRFTLVYGNRTRQSILFFEELEALKNKYLRRFNLVNVLSRERMETAVHSGRIDTAKLQELAPIVRYETGDEFFICGPEEMIFAARDFLLEKGIEAKKIHFELFTIPGQTQNQKPKTKNFKLATGDTTISHITIKSDGRYMDFDLLMNSEQSILDGALAQGADLPYACKGGVCCTCKARLLEGQVEMDVHWGLEEHEIAEGYILTCQSHPVTEKVVVDFDVK